MARSVCKLRASSWFIAIDCACWIFGWVVVASIVASLPAYAQEASAADKERLNQEHLATMAKRASRLSINYPGRATQRPLQLLQDPVMRTGNKDGNPDGGLWLWLDGKQPIATLCVWNR